MRFPMAWRNSIGIGPFISIVRYEMQRRASSRNGAVIAFVGHAAMHLEHDPQRLNSGPSGSMSIVVKISARKSQLPSLRLIRLVCLPTTPRPDLCAKSRSNNGPVSTYHSERVDGPPD